ncbi:MAG: O-antigen ligase family protein [Xanthomonadaceae bacterium]|jgi:O-antigen ligase|nr:O-antigen ligase family protein [Xanthomonadaceae bacterium]
MKNYSADAGRDRTDAGHRRWAPVGVLAFVALWPLPAYAEGALALAVLAALCLWARIKWRGGAIWPNASMRRLVIVLFLAYWLPELLSAFDALDRPRAWREVAADLRYLPFMWLAAMAMADARDRRATVVGLAVIVAVWTLDGLAQTVIGTSPLFWSLETLKQGLGGSPSCPATAAAQVDRLSGVFGSCNLKLGLVLASLASFALAIAARSGRFVWLIVAALIGMTVVLAGARAAWITFGLVALVSGWHVLGGRRLLAAAAAGVVGLLAVSAVSPQVQQRIERTASAWESASGGLDNALSGRMRIWSAAVCMIREHPVNGVGVRSFRAAYSQCDPAPETAAAWGEGAALHAHQLVLEILSETGAIGLLCWLLAAIAGVKAWREASPAVREQARPATLALVVTVFPLNTHLAFYSTFWGGVAIVLAALYAGAITASPGANRHE